MCNRTRTVTCAVREFRDSLLSVQKKRVFPKKNIVSLRKAYQSSPCLALRMLCKNYVFFPKNLIFLDESGVNTAMTRRFARTEIGNRAFAHAPRNWGTNVSMVAAISLNGLVEAMTVIGSVDGRIFLEFVRCWLICHLCEEQVVGLTFFATPYP